MPKTFEAIASVTVGSGGAANISFTSIPQTYTDLCVVVSARCDRALYVDDYRIVLNGATTTFWYRAATGDGSAVNTYGGVTNSNNIGVTTATQATANTFSNGRVYIANYTSANDKAFMAESASENNATAAQIWLNSNYWQNTAAITTIALDQGDGSNWLQYTTAYLYGIKNT